MRTSDLMPSEQTSGPDLHQPRAGQQWAIGTIGTAARVCLGLGLVSSVVWGEWTKGVHLASWVLGLVGFPAVLLGWQVVRARLTTAPFRATGPLGFALNGAIFLALYLTPFYAPALAFMNDAALLFYGVSTLLAAFRIDAGDLAQDHLGVPLPAQYAADRRRDVGG
jgi:hypothetical protein